MTFHRRFAVIFAIACAALAQTSVAGKWKFVFDTEGGIREQTQVFEQSGEAVTGKWEDADIKGTFKNGKLNLSFPLHSKEGGFSATLNINASLEADALKGSWEFGGHGGTFTASRVK